MAALKTRVGTLVVAGDTPPGASVFVDDRLRGTLPLSAALRVGVGGHVVRLEKDRFDPIVATVDISARRESTVLLRATAKKGRLVIGESHGWALQVELDGKDVGVTPWEGAVETGDHQVKLKGFVGLAALTECAAPDVGAGGTPKAATDGAKVESAAVTASVRLYEVTPVALGAEERDASLRLESTPSRATVSIDSRVVGQTPWEGRLGLGEHAIDLNAAGFFPATQRVQLVRHKQRELQIVLEREPDTARLHKIRVVGPGVSYGVGALGLGVFAVTGGLALTAVKELETECPDHSCFRSEHPKITRAATLGTVSTMGLVVGSLGLVAGTTVILLTRPPDEKPRPSGRVALSRPTGPSWNAGLGLGLGRFTVEGTF